MCGAGGGGGCTFGQEYVSVRAGEGAVNLADKLHVVEEGVEGVEVGEAHHVGGAASCSLEKDPESVIPAVQVDLILLYSLCKDVFSLMFPAHFL